MKKVFALLLVLALALSAVAFAEEVPADEAIPSPKPFEVTVISPEGVSSTVTPAEQDPTTQALLEAIVQQDDNNTVFASAGVEDLSDYELVELVALTLADYDESMGPVVLNIRFGASFETSAKLITLLGLIEGTEVTWQNVSFQIEENGTLTITLTPEQAKAVVDGTAVLAVLQKKAAE